MIMGGSMKPFEESTKGVARMGPSPESYKKLKMDTKGSLLY